MDLLTINEAAKLSRMSPSWWRQRVFKREIKFLKIGRSVRIPRSTIEEVLSRSVIEPRGKLSRG